MIGLLVLLAIVVTGTAMTPHTLTLLALTWGEIKAFLRVGLIWVGWFLGGVFVSIGITMLVWGHYLLKDPNFATRFALAIAVLSMLGYINVLTIDVGVAAVTSALGAIPGMNNDLLQKVTDALASLKKTLKLVFLTITLTVLIFSSIANVEPLWLDIRMLSMIFLLSALGVLTMGTQESKWRTIVRWIVYPMLVVMAITNLVIVALPDVARASRQARLVKEREVAQNIQQGSLRAYIVINDSASLWPYEISDPAKAPSNISIDINSSKWQTARKCEIVYDVSRTYDGNDFLPPVLNDQQTHWVRRSSTSGRRGSDGATYLAFAMDLRAVNPRVDPKMEKKNCNGQLGRNTIANCFSRQDVPVDVRIPWGASCEFEADVDSIVISRTLDIATCDGEEFVHVGGISGRTGVLPYPEQPTCAMVYKAVAKEGHATKEGSVNADDETTLRRDALPKCGGKLWLGTNGAAERPDKLYNGQRTVRVLVYQPAQINRKICPTS